MDGIYSVVIDSSEWNVATRALQASGLRLEDAIALFVARIASDPEGPLPVLFDEDDEDKS